MNDDSCPNMNGVQKAGGFIRSTLCCLVGLMCLVGDPCVQTGWDYCPTRCNSCNGMRHICQQGSIA
ncbi:hypothetical protein ACKUB1_01795 [Methanospirillum stamsii]|uniref:hypothetical protein n=1 Tax=Methanospirillum stamsii TaxID=1277351 RepID=UPI0011B20275|nr:hypothetical protein [Methanospirillum stamsii]